MNIVSPSHSISVTLAMVTKGDGLTRAKYHNMSKLASYMYTKLPELSILHCIRKLYVSGSVAGYVACITIIIVLCVVALGYCLRRRRWKFSPKPEDPGHVKIEMQSMPPVVRGTDVPVETFATTT